MNPVRKRLRNAPIKRIREWARRPDLEKRAPAIQRLRSRRQEANITIAPTVYAQLEKEGYFTGLRLERGTPVHLKLVGEPGSITRRREPKIEHFMDLASLATELQRQKLSPESRSQKIAKMDALLSEMSLFFMNSRERSGHFQFKKTELFYITPLIAASQALQEMGINVRSAAGKKIRRGVLRELFLVSTAPLQRRIEFYLEGKTKKFIKRKREITHQLEREFMKS